jgi:diguanylate cyclase (GGDEF)-like protein
VLSVHRQGTRPERSEHGAPDSAGEAKRPHEARLRPRAELLDQLLQRQPLLALVNLAAAGLAAFTLSQTTAASILIGWLTFVLATQLVRVVTYLRFSRPPIGPDHVPQLASWLTWSSLAAGLAWGLFGAAFGAGEDRIAQVLVPFVLAGMSAGAITALPSHPPAFLGFVLPSLLPYILTLVSRGDRLALMMAAITAVYLAGISVMALDLHRSLRQAARAHWRNLRLVRRLERSRRDLEQRVDQRTTELRAVNEALVGEVAQRRRSEQRVRHLLAHDALTNLPNRLLLLDRLHHALVRTRRYGGLVAVMAFDIDRFKEINDTHGHPAGDAVLREIAARIRSVLRATDTAARIGGDEFALVVPDLADPSGAVRLAEKLLAVCDEPIDAAGLTLSISISIGIALYPLHGEEVDDLLTGADLALYGAKAAGRNRWLLFSADLRAAAHARRRLEFQLRDAVARDQLRLVYQPRFSLDDNRMVAAEALLRWQHPEHGNLSPRDFIGVAESSGVIREIGRWVLRAACEQARVWRDAGMPVRVAVNLSPVEFRQPDLPDQIRATLEAAGIEPALLELEITESAYMDQRADGLEDELQRVKALGVQLAIDDFGTGYSCLSYLRWVPFDILKIDRSFVTNMVEDQRDEAIVRTIVTLARHLDKTVVAEGVEKPHQLAALRRLGCHEAQGFLLGRPVAAEIIRPLVAA